MSKLYAYSRTMAGAARRQQERGQPIAAIGAPKVERSPAPLPVASNVVQIAIPRTDAKQIIVNIAEKFGFTHADMIGPGMNRRLVIARHRAIAEVSKARPTFSRTQVGRLFGRDASTISQVLKKMGMT